MFNSAADHYQKAGAARRSGKRGLAVLALAAYFEALASEGLRPSWRVLNQCFEACTWLAEYFTWPCWSNSPKLVHLTLAPPRFWPLVLARKINLHRWAQRLTALPNLALGLATVLRFYQIYDLDPQSSSLGLRFELRGEVLTLVQAWPSEQALVWAWEAYASSSSSLENLARMAYFAQDYTRAEYFLDQALKQKPNRAKFILRRKAFCLARQTQWSEALQSFMQALAMGYPKFRLKPYIRLCLKRLAEKQSWTKSQRRLWQRFR